MCVVPDIIRISRFQNSLHRITGVLLFDGLNFTQYFEGDDAEVDTLLAKILRDPRHKNITVLLAERLETRLYEDWKMGYIDISEQSHEPADIIAQANFNIEAFKKIVDRFLF